MPITIVYTDTSSPNPSLWLDLATIDGDKHYAISPISPDEHGQKGIWDKLYEFCALLAVSWLQGTRPAKWGVTTLGASGLASAAETLTGFLTQAAQVDYAVKALGGAKTTIESVTGATPVGTKIWAASNDHVVAAYIDSASTFLLYDPNTGNSRSIARNDFVETMRDYRVDLIVTR